MDVFFCCTCSSPVQIFSVQFWHPSHPCFQEDLNVPLRLAAVPLGPICFACVYWIPDCWWKTPPPHHHHPMTRGYLLLCTQTVPKLDVLHLQALCWPVSLWHDHHVTFTQTAHGGGVTLDPWQPCCAFTSDSESAAGWCVQRTGTRLDNSSVCYTTCVDRGLHNEHMQTVQTHLNWLCWINFSFSSSRRAAWTCAAFQWWGCLHWDPQSLQQLQRHHQCGRRR